MGHQPRHRPVSMSERPDLQQAVVGGRHGQHLPESPGHGGVDILEPSQVRNPAVKSVQLAKDPAEEIGRSGVTEVRAALVNAFLDIAMSGDFE
jgi:hypothetical protein